MPQHVFISYSRKDTAFVEQLERDLNARGIVTWRDTSSIVGGEEWYRAIVRGIHNAYAMVQIVTSASEESRWVLREGLYADQRGVPIIPLLPKTYPVPFHLIATQPIVCEDDHDAAMARLISALQTLRDSAGEDTQPELALGPADRDTELAYLDFLLSQMKAELRTARYVNLGASRERAPQHPAQTTTAALDDFDLDFERLEPLVQAERIHGEQFDQPGEVAEDARIPLREMARAILLGEPGSGKTTTLQQLTIDMARAAQDDPTAPLPVFVPLRSYQGAEPFQDFVRAQMGILQSQYTRLLAQGRLVLLLDALNEMQRSANGRSLVTEVRDYLRDKQPWVVSCRVRDYQEELHGLPDVGKVRLKPLGLPRIKDVIDRRFAEEPKRGAALWQDLKGSDALIEAWIAFEQAGKTEEFWHGNNWPDDLGLSWISKPGDDWDEMRRDNRRMMLLCRNPFMLFMVCGTFERMGDLPPNRGALFGFFVDNLLKREQRTSQQTGRAWIDSDIIRDALAQLAYAMQVSETGTEITRVEAERILTDLPEVSDPALLLRLAAAASLLDVGENVRYTHQLLQEYFASEIMGMALDRDESPARFWPADRWWEPQGWEETAIILAGVRGEPEAVARWIAPAQPDVAFQALTESGVEVDLATIDANTRAALVDSARDKTGETNRVARAAAYRVLDSFDVDNRPGIGLRPDGLPDIDWVEIPAGEFTYQENQRIHLPTFHIARYPVTYRQFQAFIDADDGFHNPQWWQGLAAGDDHKAAPDEQWFKFWNHPRDDVSWWDAVAFCRWLSARLGYEVRLPTEQEWEKAARGTDGRTYPYGNEFDAAKGNTSETGIGQTSAVGIFPSGASPYGVLDMSGNVWEWCLNEYENPDSTGLGGSAARVVRGGSWSHYRSYARAAVRGRYAPYGRYVVRGFRVVCARPMQ